MIEISVCMIVKNEEKVLERCLNSLKGIWDELIIVDTGSSDNTKKIAGKYTDKIYDFEWIDDFSAARNFACSKAKKDYIYMADADELLDEENIKKFLQIKQVLLPEIEIVQMKYSNQLEFGTTYNYDEEYRPKLFKRLREFKWTDPIHETININPIIYDSEIKIIHKPVANHGNRDFSIFQKVIKRGERLSAKLITMYAKELYISGIDENFIEAEEYFDSVISDESRSLDEIKAAQCVVARAGRIKKNDRQFFQNVLKLVADNPCSEVCYEIGEYYFDLKDYKEAIIWYYNGVYETQSILSIRLSGDISLKRLSECYGYMGDKEQAVYYNKLAQEYLDNIK